MIIKVDCKREYLEVLGMIPELPIGKKLKVKTRLMTLNFLFYFLSSPKKQSGIKLLLYECVLSRFFGTTLNSKP